MPEKALALKTTSQNKLRAKWAEVMQQTEVSARNNGWLEMCTELIRDL